MNFADMIEYQSRLPGQGWKVRVNSNARSQKHHGREGVIATYDVVVEFPDGTLKTFTAKSIDIDPAG